MNYPIDLLKRMAESANIAEAWRKRRYPAHFVSKLSDSDGELAETQHWLETAFACHYLTKSIYETLMGQCQEIGRMLGSMMAHPEQFCK